MTPNEPKRLVDAVIEWRDARADYLRCIDTAPHEDQTIPSLISARFAHAEDALFQVAKGIAT